MDIRSIESPTLILDVAKTKKNIQHMVEKASQHGLRFRPHFKTHQSTDIAEWFRQEGVESITVSSVEMAAYFQANGWQDITIAFPANSRQLKDINLLAERGKLGLLFESLETIRYFAENLTYPVDAWLKIDVGANRTGIPWDQPEVILPLAAEIQNTPFMRLRGLLTHAGQTYHASSTTEIVSMFQESIDRINLQKNFLLSKGIPRLEISVGDTPGCCLANDFSDVDEIRPGNFVFFDAQQLQLGSCSFDEISVALACPVVAMHHDRSEVVVYGGAIHLSKDYLYEDKRQKFGYVSLPDENGWKEPIAGAYVRALSQEHGVIHIPENSMHPIHIGDILYIIPAHSCLTVSAMRKYLTLENEWLPTLYLC